MKKITLVEAGNFLIGLDSDAIKAIHPPEDLQQTSRPALHLESFFRQQACAPVEDGTVLQMKEATGLPDLQVDRIGTEIDMPAHFSDLPPLYPALAAECCPQIFFYAGQPVLQLDVHGLARVVEKIGVDIGDTLPDSASVTLSPQSFSGNMEADILQKDEILTEEMSGDVSAGADPSCENSVLCSDESNTADTPAGDDTVVETVVDKEQSFLEELTESSITSDDEFPDAEVLGASLVEADVFQEESVPAVNEENTKNSPVNSDDVADSSVEKDVVLREELTESEFADVVCWTIEKYLSWDGPAELELVAGELSVGLIQGVEESALDEVVTKTLHKCRVTSAAGLQMIIKELQEKSGQVEHSV